MYSICIDAEKLFIQKVSPRPKRASTSNQSVLQSKPDRSRHNGHRQNKDINININSNINNINLESAHVPRPA